MIASRLTGPALVAALLISGNAAAQESPDRASLRADLSAVMSAPLLSRSHWSILIKSLDRGDVIFEQNSRKLVMPASNMKVFTMAAAAVRLGWDFRYRTTLESTGPIVNGILAGDLIVRGSGDPSIGSRDGVDVKTFDEWATQLKAAGVTAIDGRIIGDDDAFDDEEIGNGWSWDDLAYGYSAPVGALTYNESLITITARPGASVGTPAVLEVAPGEHGLTILNHTATSEEGKPGTLDVRRERGATVLEVVGTVPLAADRPAVVTASVDNPTVFFVRSLRRALISRGIPVSGPAIDRDQLSPDDPARATSGFKVLASHESAPLTEVGRTFLKVSQNLYGELLVKKIGERAGSGAGTTARGQQLIRETLDGWRVPADSYILADGSGLSRMNFVSAEALVDILEHVYADPAGRQGFLRALPVGGEDGTLRNRLKAAWTVGQVHAKTGSLTGARALSGYVTTRRGETLVFSIVANNFSLPAWRIERVIDLLVEIIAR